MGETGAIGGTVRFVDSSVERLQVKLSGFDPSRHVVTCNRRPVPLAPGIEAGTAVGGVRFQGVAAGLRSAPDDPGSRAADLRHLRPLVGTLARGLRLITSPIPRAQLRHVPGQRLRGRGARLARFEDIGHTPGAFPGPRPRMPDPSFPTTLDLGGPPRLRTEGTQRQSQSQGGHRSGRASLRGAGRGGLRRDVAPDGSVRPVYRPVVDALAALSRTEREGPVRRRRAVPARSGVYYGRARTAARASGRSPFRPS